MSTSVSLVIAAACIGLLYLSLFTRTVSLLSASQRQVLAGGRASWWFIAVMFVAGFGAPLAPNPTALAGLTFFVLALLIWGGWRQHQRLIASGFEPDLAQRFLRQSALAGLGIALLFVSAAFR